MSLSVINDSLDLTPECKVEFAKGDVVRYVWSDRVNSPRLKATLLVDSLHVVETCYQFGRSEGYVLTVTGVKELFCSCQFRLEPTDGSRS